MVTHAQRMLALRVVLGSLWGSLLFVAGVRVAASYAMGRPGQGLLQMSGVGLAASGMFVFSMVVADRLFPRADQRLCVSVQAMLGLLQVGGLVCFGVYFWRWLQGSL